MLFVFRLQRYYYFFELANKNMKFYKKNEILLIFSIFYTFSYAFWVPIVPDSAFPYLPQRCPSAVVALVVSVIPALLHAPDASVAVIFCHFRNI